MKTRFRISENDTIKATLTKNGKIVASLYDSSFTTINQVIECLNRKVNDCEKGKGDFYYSILNVDKDMHKGVERKRLTI